MTGTRSARATSINSGVLGRWETPYQTLDFSYEAQEIRELGTLAAKGGIA